jgi:pimeloyl-ACP methyl ester carboxylesterase
VRAALGLLERLSPGLAGLAAERLWFRRPPLPSAARRERRTPAGGEAFTVAWSGGVVSGRVYGDPGAPLAYLVHGWGGWWQQLAAHVDPLLAAGMGVVAFDAPSHGQSGPGRLGPRATTLVEFAEALAAVVAELGHPAAVIAHSAGAVGALHARRLGVDADAYALVAPPDSMTPMMRRFSSVLGVGPRSAQRMMARAERRIGLPLEQFDLLRVARDLPAHPPLLVVHDRHDPETPVAGSVALAAAWPGADLLVTEGLGHRSVLWDGAVVERVSGFVTAAAGSPRAVS